MTSAPIAAETVVPKPSLVARGIGFFSGTVGLAIKLVLLGAVNALAIWALGVLFTDGKWIAALLIGAAMVLIDVVYLLPDRRLVPLKYLVPGTVFLAVLRRGMCRAAPVSCLSRSSERCSSERR